MNEIYWITRLDGIHTMFTLILAASVIVLIASLVGLPIFKGSDEYPCFLKAFKVSISPFIISILFLVFVPTTKEALMIYGVGGMIDYLKENEKVKNIPDKCVNALDYLIDSISNDNKDI